MHGERVRIVTCLVTNVGLSLTLGELLRKFTQFQSHRRQDGHSGESVIGNISQNAR
jgi:hypothetical protein